MLLLSRRVGESIRIADDIYLTVMANDGHQVRLGFDAPHCIEIHREEIYRLKNKQKESFNKIKR